MIGKPVKPCRPRARNRVGQFALSAILALSAMGRIGSITAGRALVCTECKGMFRAHRGSPHP
jgi:hypothetical protein